MEWCRASITFLLAKYQECQKYPGYYASTLTFISLKHNLLDYLFSSCVHFYLIEDNFYMMRE